MKENTISGWGIIGLIIILSIALSGCNVVTSTHVVSRTLDNAVLVSTPTPFKTWTPRARKATATLHPTSTPKPTVTATATVTPTPTAIAIGSINKDLLMRIAERRFDSIGILRAGETNPGVLLREPKHSFEYPAWSHSGEWVAFLQVDYGIQTGRLGIIRADGTEKRIFAPAYQSIWPPAWSADDKLLGAMVGDKSGVFPYIINVETEEVTPLLSKDRFSPGKVTAARFFLSPKTMQAVFIAIIDDDPLYREIWLLNLDGSHPEHLTLPEAFKTDCPGITFTNPVEWSPDGDAFLIPVVEKENRGCKTVFWIYEVRTGIWRRVLEHSGILYNQFWDEFSWSPGGHWVALQGDSRILIYSTDNWQLQRRVEYSNWVISPALVNPWAVDNHGNEIFVVSRSFTIPELTHSIYEIWGISPNGTKQDDKLLFKIEAKEPPWIRIGAFSPWMWRP